MYQNMGTSHWEFFVNSGLGKFRHSTSIVELDRRRSTKLTVPPSCDARPLLFIAGIVKLCLLHDVVARVNYRQLRVVDFHWRI